MGYPPALREKVKAAWLSGEYRNGTEIAKAFGVAENSVYLWSTKYKWGTFKEKVAEKIAEKTADKMADWILRHAKVGQFLQTKGVRGLQVKDETAMKTIELNELVKTGSDIERKALTYGREDNPVVNVNFVNLWKIASVERSTDGEAPGPTDT